MAYNSRYITQFLQAPPVHGIPQQVLDNLLGRGLNSTDWQREVEALRYTWKPIHRNCAIERELWYFKGEIEELKALPNTNTGPGPKSNSCRSILLRIQGKTGEKARRLQMRRLCGPEISSVILHSISFSSTVPLLKADTRHRCRTLENHVQQWRAEAVTTPHLFNLPTSINMGLEYQDIALPTDLPDYNILPSFSLPSATFTNISMGTNTQQASYSIEPSPSNANNLRHGNLGFDSDPWTLSQISETPTEPPFNMPLNDSLVSLSMLNTTESDINISQISSSVSSPVTTATQEVGSLSAVLETAFEDLHYDFCYCEICFQTEAR
jgi:hypothetical protein